MKKLLSILIPTFIILGTIFVIYIIFQNPPQIKRETKEFSPLEIETLQLKTQNTTILLESYGIVDASTKTILSAEISGKVIYTHPNFKNGGSFTKGELLVQIDEKEYEADVMIAKSQLLLAKQTLLEEEAKAQQAKEEWEKFNPTLTPNEMVLRIPQLETAKANLLAAQANLNKAERNLEKTKIYAPFSGKVIEKNISIAEFVTTNTSLGTIYETDSLEIRLPLSHKDLLFFDRSNETLLHKVTLTSKLTKQTYQGKIIRIESTIDPNTKQLYVVCEFQNPPKDIILGEYFHAIIEGNKIQNALMIPNETLYQNSYVYSEKEGKIYQKTVEILWQNGTHALIQKGLQEDDNLVITPLGMVSSGTKVKVIKHHIQGFNQ